MAMATKFQAADGGFPHSASFSAYSAVELITTAMKTAKSTEPKKVRDARENLMLSCQMDTFDIRRRITRDCRLTASQWPVGAVRDLLPPAEARMNSKSPYQRCA